MLTVEIETLRARNFLRETSYQQFIQSGRARAVKPRLVSRLTFLTFFFKNMTDLARAKRKEPN